MRFRLRAFGLHLAASAAALTLILGTLDLGWYRWPGWYLSGVLHVLVILGSVDLALGPTLTLLIADPRKPRAELARDIAIIVAVQIVALVYGTATLWQGRPLYYAFSADSLEMVQASDLKTADVGLARRVNPALAPHWYSRPRWVWAPLPDNPEEAAKIVNSAVLGGGQDVTDMPRYYRPWAEGLADVRSQLADVEDLKYLSKSEKQSLRARLAKLGVRSDRPDSLIMWGNSRRVVVLFDPATLAVRTILAPP